MSTLSPLVVLSYFPILLVRTSRDSVALPNRSPRAAATFGRAARARSSLRDAPRSRVRARTTTRDDATGRSRATNHGDEHQRQARDGFDRAREQHRGGQGGERHHPHDARAEVDVEDDFRRFGRYDDDDAEMTTRTLRLRVGHARVASVARAIGETRSDRVNAAGEKSTRASERTRFDGDGTLERGGTGTRALTRARSVLAGGRTSERDGDRRRMVIGCFGRVTDLARVLLKRRHRVDE